MKFTIDIECTFERGSTLMVLPDVLAARRAASANVGNLAK